jgi:nicotinamide-nucleotide amidase
MEKKIESLVKKLIKELKKRKIFLGVMESCTGGGFSNVITNVEGASEIFKGGIVAYSNEIKIKFGVSKDLIKKYSVYSKEVALAMAKAVKRKLNTDVGVGITGSISRPDPKEIKSKVGEVFVAVSFKNKSLVNKFLFPNKKRSKVKLMIIFKTLKMIFEILKI